MKITKQRLKELITEEVRSVQGQDLSNESAYADILNQIVPVIRQALGPNANLYKVLTGMAEMYAMEEWHEDDAGHETVADRKWADNPNNPVTEEKQENNPWAICTDSVGREDKDKYESCVKSVKKQNKKK